MLSRPLAAAHCWGFIDSSCLSIDRFSDIITLKLSWKLMFLYFGNLDFDVPLKSRRKPDQFSDHFPRLTFLKVVQEQDFKICFTRYPNDITLCLWSGFIYPWIRTFDRKTFSRPLFQKEAFQNRFMDSDSWNEAVRSTCSSQKIFALEITWITWKTKQDLESGRSCRT